MSADLSVELSSKMVVVSSLNTKHTTTETNEGDMESL